MQLTYRGHFLARSIRRPAESATTLALCAGLIACCVSTAARAESTKDSKEKAAEIPVIREKSEWSNIWWDCANDPSLPRILLIGDSISCGYSRVVTKHLQGRYHVDRLGTSRSINDPVFLKQTTTILQEFDYAVVHFNNGLHGFHLKGPQYAASLRAYAEALQKLAGDAKLVWGASTPITKSRDVNTLDPTRNAVVTERNGLAAEIMKDNGIPVADLYAAVVGKPDLRSMDGYHYNKEGYAVLGQAVTDAVLAALKP